MNAFVSEAYFLDTKQNHLDLLISKFVSFILESKDHLHLCLEHLCLLRMFF